MQMLDQQVAPPRQAAEQRLDLAQRNRIDLPALGVGSRLAAAGTGMTA
jgi:hypothetical protein